MMGRAMFNLLLKTSSCHRPQQIAGAVCLGLACGLLPKDTLLFPLGLLVLYCAPIHLFLSVSLVTLVSLWVWWSDHCGAPSATGCWLGSRYRTRGHY